LIISSENYLTTILLLKTVTFIAITNRRSYGYHLLHLCKKTINRARTIFRIGSQGNYWSFENESW